jgi:hypothetical protein
MKWITRERPKIDRIACPWLIKRFVDKEAEIIYVPFEEVIKKFKKLQEPVIILFAALIGILIKIDSTILMILVSKLLININTI